MQHFCLIDSLLSLHDLPQGMRAKISFWDSLFGIDFVIFKFKFLNVIPQVRWEGAVEKSPNPTLGFSAVFFSDTPAGRSPRCCSWLVLVVIYIYTHFFNMQFHTSSTAQGGGGSFKKRKTIGDIGCCESQMSKQKH